MSGTMMKVLKTYLIIYFILACADASLTNLLRVKAMYGSGMVIVCCVASVIIGWIGMRIIQRINIPKDIEQ